jgi:RNA polymerase sigma factor (sigma-70 family)
MTRWNDGRLVGTLARLAEERTDEDAWRQLYDCAWRFALSIALRRLHDPAAAEDAAQEAFVRIARYYPFEKAMGDGVFLAYLARVAENVARDAFSRRTAREVPQLEALADFADRGANVEQQVVIFDTFRRLVEQLDESDRTVLNRLLGSGADSTSELAAELHISYGNAAVRLTRMRKKIKSLLGRL